MAYEGLFFYNGAEFSSNPRTYYLARTLGIPSVVVNPSTWAGVLEALGYDPLDTSDFSDPTQAPWYDPDNPASVEFAGCITMEASNLDSTNLSAPVTEYTGRGGRVGRQRKGTVDFVYRVNLVASTERGMLFGYNWLTKLFDEPDDCSGSGVLIYLSRPGTEPGAQLVARNGVRMSRGLSVTRKRSKSCSVLWTVTFTLTAGDPSLYGSTLHLASGIGGPSVAGDSVMLPVPTPTTAIEAICAVPDTSPIFDPLFPALVPPPAPPSIIPAGWEFVPGRTYKRHWAQLEPFTSEFPDLVSILDLASLDEDARSLRVSIWGPSASPTDNVCQALWSVVISYVATDFVLSVDGAAQVVKAYSGVGTIRRADTLVYSMDGSPPKWPVFSLSDTPLGLPNGFQISLDQLEKVDEPGVFEGGDGVRLAVAGFLRMG